MKRAPAFFLPATIGCLIAAQALFVAGYVGHERTIYFWDHAMYFGMARNLYANFAQNSSAAWIVFQTSLADNYNLIFALPSLISFSLFDATRPVFILTNFFVFFLAYEAALAFFLVRALKLDPGPACLVSLVVCSLIVPLWLPLLEGYPDAGAAACIVLAAEIGLQEAASKKILRRAIALGFALGAAVLLRRHFVYPSVALLLSLGCLTLWDVFRAPRNRRAAILRAAYFFGICGAAFIGVLALVAPDFLTSALTTDYNALYLSYRRPPDIFLYFILGGFGLGLLLTAFSGLIVLARSGKRECRVSVFIALFVVFWFAVWTLGPDQMGHHYMLHVLPFATVIGFTGWVIFFGKKRGRGKNFLAAAWLFMLGVNSAWALWFSPSGVWPNDNGTPGLFSAPRPPVVRDDIDAWRRLTDHLQQTTNADDRIMIVGSSFIFNQDIFHQIYIDTPNGANTALRLPKTPEIDHEEPAPLDVFAASDVYVVPTPPQYHLDPSGQRVVTAAANQFPPPPGRSAMFRADDETYPLTGGVKVQVWRRRPWTPGALHDALTQIRKDAAADSIFAQDWVTLNMPLRAQSRSDFQGSSTVAGLFDPNYRTMKLFFDHPLPPGDGRLGFTFAGTCGSPQLRLAVVGTDGHIETSKDFDLLAVPGEVFQSFTVPTASSQDHYLELGVTLTPAVFCQAELHDLRIEKTDRAKFVNDIAKACGYA